MNYPRVASGYSRALLDLAVEQNVLDAVREDAALYVSTVAASYEFKTLMRSPVVKADKKQAILKEIFGDKVSELFTKFMMLVTKNGRESVMDAICMKFEEDVLAHKGIIKANVTTAVAMSDAQKTALAQKLAAQLGKEIVLEESVDPSVMGGAKIEVGGYQLDQTVAGKLRAVKNALLS